MIYTPEMTKEVLDSYANNEPLEQIANKHSKSVRSIIAKLSREGVYRTASVPERRQRKNELINAMAARLNIAPASIASLEKATHEALNTIHQAIVAQSIADVVECELAACADSLLGSEI